MQPVLNVRDVPGLEAAIEQRGVDAAELMRRAGTVVAQQAMREVDQGAVVVLCGPGNNGGDGWVAADYLAGHGLEVNVVTAAEPSLIRSAAARQAAQRACTVGIPVHVAPDYEELAVLLVEADVVIDAVFGTGFKGVMSEPFDMWVEVVDDYFEGMVLSVDVPSGINAATGEAEGPFFQADTTLTMFALKPGLIAGLGKQASGQLVVASLVGDDEGSEELADTASAYLLGEADYLDALPERDEFADKYGHGRVLVVAGSTRFPGAAIMAAKAAARSGAGYVTLAVPAPVVPIAQAHLLSIPVVGLPAAQDGTFEAAAAQELASLAAKADCVLAGPGMGTSFGAGEVVRALIASSTPLVLDADALNVAASICLGNADVHPNALRREAPLVLTPHARELARLLGRETGSICCLTDLMDAAQSLAWAVGSSNFAVVAKAATSCVSCIETTLVPKAGPSALGTAGTGDVLAGIVAGLLSQQARVTTQSGSLNLRAAARKNATVLRTIPQYALVTVEERGNAWCRIVYAGTGGYVMTQFLTFLSSEESASATATPAPAATQPPRQSNQQELDAQRDATLQALPAAILGRAMPPEGSALFLRAGCAEGASITAQISRLDYVIITATGNTWCAVEYEGRSGYCLRAQLEF